MQDRGGGVVHPPKNKFPREPVDNRDWIVHIYLETLWLEMQCLFNRCAIITGLRMSMHRCIVLFVGNNHWENTMEHLCSEKVWLRMFVTAIKFVDTVICFRCVCDLFVKQFLHNYIHSFSASLQSPTRSRCCQAEDFREGWKQLSDDGGRSQIFKNKRTEDSAHKQIA